MRPLVITSVLIVLAAVWAPGLLTRVVQRPEASVASARAEGDAGVERGGAVSRAAGTQIEVKAARDGHFYVDAEINFRSVRLMVDTGASVVALRQSDADALGLRPRRADFEHPVQTANGTILAAAAELDSVAVGDIEVDGVQALILPDAQLGISLLGASFLNRLERFQISDGTLTFEN